MGIHSKARQSYFDDNFEESIYANSLSEAFDISFGHKWGDLSYWIASPSQRTKERFGLDQEVLVIYSAHKTTDARVITAIENITRNPDFRHRLDKVLFLLVHSGDEDAVDDLVNKVTDFVIVPFHTSFLQDKTRGPFAIRSKISSAFGKFDLFAMSSPIKNDRYFFGRDEIVNQLIMRAVRHKQNSGLFGLRKTGKTSVLHAIERKSDSHDVEAVYVDCQNPSIYGARWWQALYNIASTLSARINKKYSTAIKAGNIYTQSDASAQFASLLSQAFISPKIKHIILMLDEIEWIIPYVTGFLGKHWDTDYVQFWQSIRAIHHEFDGKITFIVAGVNPICLQQPNIQSTSNPIFQLATPFFLSPLGIDRIRNMVRTIGRYCGVEFEEEVYSYLESQYGGHPYLTRISCSVVWKSYFTNNPEKLDKISVANFLSSANDIQSNIRETVKDILLSLIWWYPDMFEVLQVLALGDRDAVSSYLANEPVYKSLFSDWGVIDVDSYEFTIKDLKHFILAEGESYKNTISPFARSDFDMSLLPNTPDQAMLSALFEKKIALETKLRKTVFLYIGMKSSWNSQKISLCLIEALKHTSRKDPENLFIGREPKNVMDDLYVLEMKTIILQNWEIFGALFKGKQALFEMNMDNINIARRHDSHTKYAEQEDILSFHNSYDWVLSCLKDVP